MKSKDNPVIIRLSEALGANSIKNLAEILNVSRVSASDIDTNGVPSRWLLLAVWKKYNPQWIETGKGPKYLIASNFPYFGEFQNDPDRYGNMFKNHQSFEKE